MSWEQWLDVQGKDDRIPDVTLPDGTVSAQVFPQTAYDRIFYSGVTADVCKHAADPVAATGQRSSLPGDRR